jgi:hypothetical protein
MLDQLQALAAPCAAILMERGQSVAVADGSTGGLIAAGMLTIPGGIKFFRGGGVLYSLKGRQVLFGLEPEAFDGLKPVTGPYTLLQADAIRRRLGHRRIRLGGPDPPVRNRRRHQLHRGRRPRRVDQPDGRNRLVIASPQYGSLRQGRAGAVPRGADRRVIASPPGRGRSEAPGEGGSIHLLPCH